MKYELVMIFFSKTTGKKKKTTPPLKARKVLIDFKFDALYS